MWRGGGGGGGGGKYGPNHTRPFVLVLGKVWMILPFSKTFSGPKKWDGVSVSVHRFFILGPYMCYKWV